MNAASYLEEFPEIPASRYKVVQKLGYGAFSVVFLAYTPDQQRRAIKRLRLTSKPKMMLKEIEFMRRLRGKETISYLKEVLFSEQTYQTSLVTSYIETTEFRQMLHYFTPEIVQYYMYQLLTALSHLESTDGGILHRDVKPGNFLFDIKTRRGMLIDFGLAQSFKEAQLFAYQPLQTPVEKTAGNLPKFVNIFHVASQQLPKQPHAGTHGYRAPEVLFPLFAYTQKIDVWSAGVILLQILTGKTGLFRSPTGTDTYEILAIRNFLGTDRFIYGMGKMHIDFALTTGSCMPCAISLEELSMWNNPDLFVMISPSAFDLCRRLLEFDYKARVSASRALKHEFFRSTQKTNRYQNGSYYKSILTQYENYYQDINYWVYSQRMTDICSILNLSAAQREKILDVYLMKKIYNLEFDKDIKLLVQKMLKKYQLNSREEISPFGYKITRNVDLYDYNQFEQLQKRCQINLLTTQQHPSMMVDDKFSWQSIEQANFYIEKLQRIRRNTAMRRKIDPFVQCVKALNNEWQKMQEKVRETAEEYRRAAIDLIKNDVMQVFSGATIVPSTREHYQINIDAITSLKGYYKCQASFLRFLRGKADADVFEIVSSQPKEVTQAYHNIIDFASISFRIAFNKSADFTEEEYEHALKFLKKPSEGLGIRDDCISDSVSLSETYFDPGILKAPNFNEAYQRNIEEANNKRIKRKYLHSAEHLVFDYQIKELKKLFLNYEAEQMKRVREAGSLDVKKEKSVSQIVFDNFEDIMRKKENIFGSEQQLNYLVSREYYRERSIQFLMSLLRSPLGMYFADPAKLYRCYIFSPSRLYANMKHASEKDQDRVRRTLNSLADLCMYYAYTQLCRKDFIVVNSCLNGIIQGIPVMKGVYTDRRNMQLPSFYTIVDKYPKTAKYLESQCQSVIQRVLSYPAAIDDAITELEFARDAIESRVVEVLVEELYQKSPSSYLYRDIRASIKAYGAQFTLYVMKGANMYCQLQRYNCLKAFGRRKRTVRFTGE